jgi:hypothetical protein
MDRYKFRGKRLDNGEWVYGYYQAGKGEQPHVISWWTVHQWEDEISDVIDVDEVDPATVGQYTGKQDFDKTDVYEHDIVMDFVDGVYYLVIWDDETTSYMLAPDKGEWMDFVTFEEQAYMGYRVVGNKVDNLELVEG